MNWQISKIEVSSFKAFKNIFLDFENSSLVILDGPNGFGKTSIFDAIELLLTGQIKRINDLFSKVMTKKKQNYEDNLFWNTRSGEKDLFIKIEFFNSEQKITLARYASAPTLKQKTLNRADSFSQFGLYELPDFSSTDFSSENSRNNEYIEKLFGKNFKENFCFLNYLEQGQNQLLHTRVDERKDALGTLFNITDITTEIDNCKVLERRFAKYLGDPDRKSKETELISESESHRSIAQADLGNMEYKKLSNVELQPNWDKENIFPTYSSEILEQCLASVQKLKELLFLKGAIQIRDQNERIETYIEQNKTLLHSVALFGSDIYKLDTLDQVRKELTQLTAAKTTLQRGVIAINIEEANALPGWDAERLKWFEIQIALRNELQQKSQINTSVLADLVRLKAKLLEEHSKLYPNDSMCPLCGADWQLQQTMLDAIEDRSKKIANTLSADEKALVSITTMMDNELVPLAADIQHREAELMKGYNGTLHLALESQRVRLDSITKIVERLKTTGNIINYQYSESNEIVDARLLDLVTLIRDKKSIETEALPDDWRQIINSTLKTIEDFYNLEEKDLADKLLYIRIKGNEAKSKRLQQSLESLRKIQQENGAAKRASEKVKKLRNTLESVERTYADHTISEIELIFHIYSGRLIQNYQRGLGLFIESGDGKQLRFLTAEKSEHDAILSMSSGQISALSLAFFLSLNKVYADTPLILVDDPSQSLDEVNIASLTDLLRCELRNSQLLLSSHEEDISSYMRYRFIKAGLKTCSLNMQSLAKEKL
ncbi:recombinase RecF [Acinetobacter sp. CWB-G5]|uniref:AAA family ATPase n=1 Tax=Acinetobacter sp. CWB-G5 TaxID=2855444 RepID=UPI001C44B60F|nr:AAA family ATPase [Acinetobacter sp. CWB-G5]MBV7310188.1 recombinase RecF [Acinetobacter sp. CWB-G5]